MIFNPLEEYEKKFKSLHLENVTKHFDELTKQSGINVEENRKTVKEYYKYKENIKKLKKKLGWLKFFRVLTIITILLIPIAIFLLTPKIKALKQEIANADQTANNLLNKAKSQTAPLNNLFTSKDAVDIIEKTIPEFDFQPTFSAEQEENMVKNFDFNRSSSIERSTLELLSGSYNENPFLFERKFIHTMGTNVYTGAKTIFWTEHYRDSDGRLRTRTRSQTLTASLVKPKPYYTTQVIFNYCAQGGDELSFTRDASKLNEKSEKEIEKIVKKGEKKLKKLTDKAIKQNRDFTSMANTDFEVLFDALDRNNEVQFRTLFTPLAQTNMVDLILSDNGFGDDFNFIKRNRTNKIISKHSQSRPLRLTASDYAHFSYDVIKQNYIDKNCDYFKSIYFDFAPVLAIPIYQERPVHSLKPISKTETTYSKREHEALANLIDEREITHPNTKTSAIIKSTSVKTDGKVDEVTIMAYSYDIERRIDIVPVLGGDGRMHGVPVPWDDYIPLEYDTKYYVTTSELASNKNVKARLHGLSIYK